MGLAKTNLSKIDFVSLYKAQKNTSTFKTKNSTDWNAKAKQMNKKVHESIYIEEFLNAVDLEGMQTLLDVGCGPGTLALRLAPKLDHVYAMDFSESMLECVVENSKKHDLDNITCLHKSWEDSWEDIPKSDIIIASRSIELHEIDKAIEKLNAKANKKIYISFKVGGSFVDEEILNILDRVVEPRPDYIYLVNILYQMGIECKVDFILSENMRFNSDSKEEFAKKISWSLGAVTPKEIKQLEKYYETEYRFKQDKENFIKWALLSWEPAK